MKARPCGREASPDVSGAGTAGGGHRGGAPARTGNRKGRREQGGTGAATRGGAELEELDEAKQLLAKAQGETKQEVQERLTASADYTTVKESFPELAFLGYLTPEEW